MSFPFKSAFLTAVCLTTASVSSFAGYAIPVQAPRPAPLSNWYLTGFAGASFLQDFHTDEELILNHKVGYDAGGAIGWRAGPIRLEGQYTFIRNSLNTINFPNGTSLKDLGIGFNSKTTAHVGLANIYYDFLLPSDVLGLYVGVGAGYAHFRNHTVVDTGGPVFSIEGTDNKFAYQGSAGITFNVDNQFYLDFGYRYLRTNHLHNIFDDRYVAHLANLGITYHAPAM